MLRSDASQRAVESLLAEEQAPVRPWQRIGMLLDEIERSQVWREGANSFTEWMQKTAPKVGLRPASLWRFMLSCRTYNDLRKEMTARGHELPELGALPPQVSAESVEIFDKLRRAAPEHVTEPIALRLVRGEVSRTELRTVWQDYRPALAGRTARGHGVSAPRADSRDPDVAESLGEAEALLALRGGDRAWTGAPDADVYAVFSRVGLWIRRNQPGALRRVLDAVVAVRAGEGADVEFHAFEVRGREFGKECGPWFEEVAPYVDYAWIAVVGPIGADVVASAPAGLGVAEIRAEQVRVRRRPERAARGGHLSVELAKQLLISALHQ